MGQWRQSEGNEQGAEHEGNQRDRVVVIQLPNSCDDVWHKGIAAVNAEHQYRRALFRWKREPIVQI